jgi:hypothetical protein
MKIELSVPQTEFFASKSTSVAVVAGFGSGKTDIAKIRCITTMRQFPGCNQLYLAPTYPLIKDIWYPKIEEYLEELKIGYRINKQDHIVDVEGLGNIYCRTMEYPSRIIGFEVLDAFLDELDVVNEEKALEVWRKTKARCRQKITKITKKGKIKKKFSGGAPKEEWIAKRNQTYVSTTPEGFKTTYNLFQGDPIPGSHLIQMSTYSNLHNLPSGYIQELMANYPAQLIKAYIMGIFVNLVNRPVWNEYDENLNMSEEYVEEKEPLIVGMDFNVGRGCAVIYVPRVDGHELHAVDEVFNSYDTPDTIRVLEERYPEHHITVIPDASGKSRKSVNATTSDIALLKQAGYIVKVNKKNPNIKDRVMATNRLFHNGKSERRLFVNKQKCPKFSSSLVHQIYDNNGLPEKGTGEDDITDAGTYPPAFLHPIKKVTTTRRELRV